MRVVIWDRFDRVTTLYVTSLFVALIDYLTLSRPKSGDYNFETFCMRVVVIFTYMLIFRVTTRYLKSKGFSDLKAKIFSLVSIPVFTLLIAYLILKF